MLLDSRWKRQNLRAVTFSRCCKYPRMERPPSSLALSSRESCWAKEFMSLAHFLINVLLDLSHSDPQKMITVDTHGRNFQGPIYWQNKMQHDFLMTYNDFNMIYTLLLASLVAQTVTNLPAIMPWVGKIPWRRKSQPTPVFLPGELSNEHTQASQVALLKNPPANAGDMRDMGSMPGSGRSPGGWHGNPLEYSCLENPWTERGAWWVTIHWVVKSWTRLKQLSTHAYSAAVIFPKLQVNVISKLNAPQWFSNTQKIRSKILIWGGVLLHRAPASISAKSSPETHADLFAFPHTPGHFRATYVGHTDSSVQCLSPLHLTSEHQSTTAHTLLW